VKLAVPFDHRNIECFALYFQQAAKLFFMKSVARGRTCKAAMIRVQRPRPMAIPRDYLPVAIFILWFRELCGFAE
jgi:hypothetical protein